MVYGGWSIAMPVLDGATEAHHIPATDVNGSQIEQSRRKPSARKRYGVIGAELNLLAYYLI